ncbi:hypothetical protein EDB87DRAFT_1831816 [Lactarius vividus]|nr:hypothetical protein EDB87DRAFT_1831816 [Lactarius vividus]
MRSTRDLRTFIITRSRLCIIFLIFIMTVTTATFSPVTFQLGLLVEELKIIEQSLKLKVISEAERPATLYSLLQHSTQSSGPLRHRLTTNGHDRPHDYSSEPGRWWFHEARGELNLPVRISSCSASNPPCPSPLRRGFWRRRRPKPPVACLWGSFLFLDTGNHWQPKRVMPPPIAYLCRLSPER